LVVYRHKDLIKEINSVGIKGLIVYIIEIIIGIILTTYFISDNNNSTISIIYLNKEVNGGYIYRVLHQINTSLIIVLIYIHIIKLIKENIYIHNIKTYYSGQCIYIMTMAIGFLGYTIA